MLTSFAITWAIDGKRKFDIATAKKVYKNPKTQTLTKARASSNPANKNPLRCYQYQRSNKKKKHARDENTKKNYYNSNKTGNYKDFLA